MAFSPRKTPVEIGQTVAKVKLLNDTYNISNFHYL